jgi:sarcosine oxidase
MLTTVVVGRGLFGTATAKYLQRVRGQRVLAVGPTTFDSKHKVYSSHNDQGRVVRLLGFDDYWTDLNMEAAAGFRDLEAETGLAIVHRTGCVTTCEIPYEHSAYFKGDRVQQTASRAGLDVQVAKAGAADRLLREKGFGAPHPKTGVENACYEDGATGAGYLSVPNLKQAQELSFVSRGGMVNNHTVLSIARHQNRTWQVHLSDGSVVNAQNVVVCCGSFCNKLGLLPSGLRALPLHLKTETVLMAKLPGKVARELAVTMPSLLLEVDTGEYEGVYAVPPMQYQDSEWYLKIGCNSPEDRHFEVPAAGMQGDDDGRWSEISRWFEGGQADAGATQRQEQALKRVFLDLYPELAGSVSLFVPKRCIITRTPTARPILSELDCGLFVATGGNGYGAMASDAIGRRAAAMVAGA